MMLMDWLAFAVIAFFVVAVWLLSLRYVQRQDVNERKMLAAMYKEQLTQLEAKPQTEENLAEREELSARILQELSPTQQHHKAVVSWYWLPGVVLFLLLTAALYAMMPGWQQQQQLADAQARLPELSQRLLSGLPLESEQDVLDLKLALRAQLAQEGSDSFGWLLLGRLSRLTEDAETTLLALERAYQLDNSNSSITLDYARALYGLGDDIDRAKGQLLLSQLVKQQPSVDVLSLYGLMLMEAGQADEAKVVWQQGLALAEVGSEQQALLQAAIEAIDKEPVSNNAELQVTVNWGADEAAPTTGFVVVFIRAHGGAPMPLAAKKVAVTGWPLVVQLTDADAMMQAQLPSAVDRWDVVARWSATADVANSGQSHWQAQLQNVDWRQNKALELVLDETH